MIPKKIDIVITSFPDKEEVVAEIYYDKDQWVEISQENEELIIRFYPPANGSYWEFLCENALNVLQEAKTAFD